MAEDDVELYHVWDVRAETRANGGFKCDVCGARPVGEELESLLREEAEGFFDPKMWTAKHRAGDAANEAVRMRMRNKIS